MTDIEAQTTIDQLCEEAESGRGLWIGLPLDRPPAESGRHPIFERLAEAPHLTLLHLGKNNAARTVKSVIDAVVRCGETGEFMKHPGSHDFRQGGLNAEITGVGTFWRKVPTQVALINSAQVVSLRNALVTTLGRDGVAINDYFGFIPHLTLRQDTTGEEFQNLLWLNKGVRIQFKTMTVFCGDHSFSLRMPDRKSVF